MTQRRGGEELRMVDWTRQFVILIIAAAFAVYWTGKQGLWDALKGSSPHDKDWKDATHALLRRLPPRYEILDGTNSRGEKRVLGMRVQARSWHRLHR